MAEALAVAPLVLPGTIRRAPRHAVSCSGAVVPDCLGDGRLPGGVRERNSTCPFGPGSASTRVEKDGDGYVVRAGDRRFDTDNVIVATGVFQHEQPVIPDFAPTSIPGSSSCTPRTTGALHSCNAGPFSSSARRTQEATSHWRSALAGHPTMLSGPDTGQIPWKVIMSRPLGPLVKFVATRVHDGLHSYGAEGEDRNPFTRRATPAGDEGGSGGGRRRARLREDRRRRGREAGARRRAGRRGRRTSIWCTGFRNDYSWIAFPVPLERTAGTRFRREAPFLRRLASTSSDCPSCIRSARCSFSEPGGTQNVSSGTSYRVRPRARARHPSSAPP